MTYTHRGYNCARIPALANYAEAKEHYKSVVPIRGRKECRPLGKNRRFTWFTIEEKQTMLPESSDILGTYDLAYALSCWGRDLVVFHSNGNIVVHNTVWHSPTTMGFLTFSLKAFGCIVSKRGKWYFQNNKGENFLMPNGEIPLRKGEDGFFRPKEQATEKRYRLNRKAINAIRKKYKNFIDYGKNALSIDPTVTRLEVAEANHGLSFEDTHLTPYYSWTDKTTDSSNRTLLFSALDRFNQSGDLQLAYELFTYIAQSGGRFSYREQLLICEPSQFVKTLEEVIKYHFAKVIFDEEEVDAGVIFHDNNIKYVSRSE